MASKLFYQQERLALIQDAREQRRLMGSEAQTHAVLSKAVQATPPVILASDALLSTLLFNTQQGTKPRCYSPYGYQPTQPGLPGFTGQVPEPVMGGYLLGNGYRLYSPFLMRFTAPDDWSPFGAAGINPYVYCKGDPVNYSDPSGHMLKALRRLVNSAEKAVLKVVDTVGYEYVKAKHGKRIFKQIDQLGAASSALPGTGATVPKSKLSPAEAKLGERMIDESLKFQKENHKITSARLQRAERGGEGSKIIYAEDPSYIADVLAIKSDQELKAIGRLEEARTNLREHQRAVSYQTRIHARLG